MRQSLKITIMAVFLIVSFLIFMSPPVFAQYSNPPKGSSSGGGTPSDTNPAMNGTAAAGSATTYSRGDHVHPTDTSKADTASLAPDKSTVPSVGVSMIGKDTSGNIVDNTDWYLTGSSLTAGHAYYMASGGSLTEADATSSETLPYPAICVAISTTICAKMGKWTTTGLTIGAYYVPASTGGAALTSTKPSTSGNQVQIMGVASSSTILEIMPQLVIVEVK